MPSREVNKTHVFFRRLLNFSLLDIREVNDPPGYSSGFEENRMGDKAGAKTKGGSISKPLEKNSSKKKSPVKRPAERATGPPGKLRKASDGEKSVTKRPTLKTMVGDGKKITGKISLKKDTDGQKSIAKKATGAQKPFMKKGAEGQKSFTKKGPLGKKPFAKKPFAKKTGKSDEKGSSDEKPKWFEMKKKDRKKMRQQQDNKFYVLQCSAKKIWEKLRRSDVRSEERNQLAMELHKLLKGNIVNVAEAHDTSRVVECLYTNGSPEIKNSVFDEIKDKIMHYAKCKYAKNLIMACLRHGSQAHKDVIYKAVQTRVPDLFLHKEAAQIISTLYEDVCNNKKKAEMAQEFYSKELVYFKSETATTFKAAYDNCTEKLAKENMLSEFKETLVKLTDKGVIKYGLYHMLLQQLFEVLTDKADRLDMIKQIQHILVEILHTKEGMQVALQCIWHSGAKERKAIAKSFKQFVNRIATDDQGHKVLMGLFDAVDDTVMLNQNIISELVKNRNELVKHKFGVKVFAYLMMGRNPCVITPDTIELLKQGDGNEDSKKDPELRRKELRAIVQQPLIDAICENFEELFGEGEVSVAVGEIMIAADEDFRRKAFLRVVEHLQVPYEKNAENHFIESNHGHFLLKKLLSSNKLEGKSFFARILMENLREDALRSWWKCNRGAFLSVRLLEVKDEEVKSWAQSLLSKDKAGIKKEKSKGAEILLEKL
ncbi:pumilio homolog 3 [Galendromus occidentalis]|uniref:Pumilio homolog 3 n=1 Tax=Galendromus occidentalis TaxID=34638 RepID=A0AAJ6QSF6_9ACAR|nr:pumilio homolog 3 [Galendromus occidentalis]